MVAQFGFGENDHLELVIRSSTEDSSAVDGFLAPTDRAGLTYGINEHDPVKLFTFKPKLARLRTYPTSTLEQYDTYLRPKYDQIEAITFDFSTPNPDYFDEADLESILEALPRGCVKDPTFGLGFLKECNRLVRLIEEHSDCREIALSETVATGPDGTIFYLTFKRLDSIWSEMVRIKDRAGRAASHIKDAWVHNSLAAELSLEPAEVRFGRHPHSKIIAKVARGDDVLTEAEQDDLIKSVSNESKILAKASPERFTKLHREVELVNLDRLIERYEESLTKKRSEGYWQAFFDDNAFALQQVFGAPMICVRSRASVGGGGISGRGAKIADYLFKNSLTSNVALVEIKKPSTPLLANTEYRPGVFGPSSEINNSVVQVLDQAYQLTSNLAVLKQNSGLWDLQSYAVACFVVAGCTPAQGETARQKSFELYRGNSRNVTIVTYNELLARLKLLRGFLAQDEMATEGQPSEESIPADFQARLSQRHSDHESSNLSP